MDPSLCVDSRLTIPKALADIARSFMIMASHVLLQTAVLGIGCTVLFGLSPPCAWAAPPGSSSSTVLTLDCLMSGGGYAIKDAGGVILENGDGVPFSPQPHAVLRVTAAPPRVLVTDGVLPHPDCTSGPVLDSFAPVRFTWCKARYEITPREVGKYSFVSTSISALTDGPHRGDLMDAFIVGACTSGNTSEPR